MLLPVTFAVEVDDQGRDLALQFGTLIAASAETQTRRALGQQTALWMKGADGDEVCILHKTEVAFSLDTVIMLAKLRAESGGVL